MGVGVEARSWQMRRWSGEEEAEERAFSLEGGVSKADRQKVCPAGEMLSMDWKRAVGCAVSQRGKQAGTQARSGSNGRQPVKGACIRMQASKQAPRLLSSLVGSG